MYRLQRYKEKGMPQSLARIYVHIVYATKLRYPYFQDRDIRRESHKYIAKIIQEKDSFPVIVNGVDNHIHILCHLSKNISIAELVGAVKRSSSKWLKTKGGVFSDFSWQRGYAAFSVGEKHNKRLKKYIENQEEHHKGIDFQTEYRDLLEEYGIEYDEQYVWD